MRHMSFSDGGGVVVVFVHVCTGVAFVVYGVFGVVYTDFVYTDFGCIVRHWILPHLHL